MPDPSTLDLGALLDRATTIAIVGCSARPTRTSHKIARYLQDQGYRIVPVNPAYDEVLGVPCYPRVQDIPADVSIDIVDIFRRADHTADMVRDVIERGKATDRKPVIWTQLGVSSAEAEALATEHALPYVKNRCIMVVHGQHHSA
ncbi:CoA-binding protein [Salisaeta longa]|uniref:CoA-binding protein n=1 Tax=Salisaeta longa TaxID=503170 RepID=UPI0003B747B0|nr:CoA-binding protein [Salisaeta longa]